MILKECVFCMEVVIKTDKINSSSCNCKGSIGNYHDSCLNHYYIKCDHKEKSICKTCNSEFIFSRNYIVNKLIRDNTSKNIILKDNLNSKITQDNINSANKFINNSIHSIYVNSLRVVISIFLLMLENNYYKYYGIIIFPFVIFKLMRFLSFNFFIVIQLAQIKIIDKIAKYSIDFVDITKNISLFLLILSSFLFYYFILYLITNKCDLILSFVFYVLVNFNY